MNLDPTILVHQLAGQLEEKLPGSFSHLRMLPPGRVLQVPGDHTAYYESAVLVLMFPAGGDIRIGLIRRPSSMKNHAGQVAFPGGKREKDDRDLVQTALREASEEVGLDTESVRVLGLLSPVYVQVSDFLITPVLAWSETEPAIRVDSSEVDEFFSVSFCEIVNRANLQNREMETRTGTILAPGYEIGGRFIWGATAMILAELDDLFAAVINCKTTTGDQTQK